MKLILLMQDFSLSLTQSLLKVLFREQKSNHWAEGYTGETAMENFEPVGEGEAVAAAFTCTTSHSIWQDEKYLDHDMTSFAFAVEPAKEALACAVERGMVVELNTGAISRRYRKSPYPAPPILQRIAQKGGKVLLSGDSHSAASLCCAFDRCEELVKALGLTVVSDDFLTK